MKEHIIEKETMLLPSVVADCVIQELECWFRQAFHMREEMHAALCERAQGCYQHNERFRKWLKRPKQGRDYLYSFMRHWLTGEVKDRYPALYPKLPYEYWNGRDPQGQQKEERA